MVEIIIYGGKLKFKGVIMYEDIKKINFIYSLYWFNIFY